MTITTQNFNCFCVGKTQRAHRQAPSFFVAQVSFLYPLMLSLADRTFVDNSDNKLCHAYA